MLRNEEEFNSDNPYDPKEKMPKMAMGGFVDDPLLQPQGSGIIGPSPIGPSNPQSNATPIPPMPQKSFPGMPPTVSSDDLEKQLGGYKQSLEKYGPEQQIDMQNSLIQARTSPGMSLANAGAGLADAIMQGVARAGSSNFQGNLQNQGNQLSGEAMATFDKAQSGNASKMQAEMKLSAEDPKSSISRAAQLSYGPTLTKLGASPDQIRNMPASLIGDISAKNITLEEALSRIAETGSYQRGMLGMKAQELRQNKNKEKVDNAKEILKANDNAKIFGTTVPWTGSVSSGDKEQALNVIKNGIGGDNSQFAEAEAWANANPNDPRAAKIRQRIGK